MSGRGLGYCNPDNTNETTQNFGRGFGRGRGMGADNGRGRNGLGNRFGFEGRNTDQIDRLTNDVSKLTEEVKNLVRKLTS